MSIVATTLYVKVKRTNTTLYVYVEPQQTIEVFAQQVGRILKKDPNEMQFQYMRKVLENGKTFQDYEIDKQTGQTICLLFKNEDGSWENIKLHDPIPRPADRDKIEAIKQQQVTQEATQTTTSSSSSSSSSSSTTVVSAPTNEIKDD